MSGPAGGREVMVVALPMVISSLSWTVMTFVDRMMLRWVNGEAMSAAFLASAVWFSSLCLPLGICSYANAFVSQYLGDQQYQKIGSAVWQAIWFGAICVPVLALGIPLAPLVFAWAQHPEDVFTQEVTYFQTLCWGSGGLLISQAAACFYSGRGKTVVVMGVDAFYAVVNLVLDYLWIFGLWGFPEMGIAGAGYATVVSLWLKAFTYVGMMLQDRHRAEFGTGSWQVKWSLFWRFIKFGSQSGLQMFLDVVGFTIFVMLVGRLGKVESEATSMAFSISSFAFMPVWGLGMAAGILVGQRLGENQEALAERATWTTLTLGLGYMALISTFYLLVPDLFLSGFFVTSQVDPTAASQQVADDSRALAAQLLRFVAAYNLFDALLTILASAIKGAGDTRFVMWTSLVMAIALATTSYFLVEVFNAGLFACWGLITLWVCGLGVIYYYRFRQGKWKSMRVIEMQHPR